MRQTVAFFQIFNKIMKNKIANGKNAWKMSISGKKWGIIDYQMDIDD